MIIASLVVMSSPTTKLLESSSPLQRLDQLVTNSSRVFKVTLVFQKTVIIGDKTDNYNSIIYNINYILKTTHLWNRLFILQVTRFASLDLRLKHSGLDAINDRKAWSSFSHPWTSWVARLVSFLSPTETLRPVYMYMNSWIPNLNWCHVCSLRFTYISIYFPHHSVIFYHFLGTTKRSPSGRNDSSRFSQ